MTCKYRSTSPELSSFVCHSQDQDVHSFIDTSMALESIATGAYIGILQFFNNKVCNVFVEPVLGSLT